MKLSDARLSLVRKAISAVCVEIARLQTQRMRWEQYSESALWAELAACILGSRVSFEVAHATAHRLKAKGLLSPDAYLRAPVEFEGLVASELASNPIPATGSDAFQRYPFPRVRAKHIGRTMQLIYGRGNSLHMVLAESDNEKQARKSLINNTVGIGPKQASLFLRNIGFAHTLAILDTHVLRYMAWTGLADLPRTPHTLAQYEKMEATFSAHTEEFGFPVGHVDVALWVVVRVARREKLL